MQDLTDQLCSLPLSEFTSARNARAKGLRPRDRELQLIESMATEWHPENYRHTYRERVETLLNAKREGHDVVTDQPTVTSSNVVDLMDALRASIDAAKGHRPGNASETGELRTRPRTGADDRDVDRLAGMTKKELYEVARDLEVDGRSSMDRSHLEDAVRSAERDSRRQAS